MENEGGMRVAEVDDFTFKVEEHGGNSHYVGGINTGGTGEDLIDYDFAIITDKGYLITTLSDEDDPYGLNQADLWFVDGNSWLRDYVNYDVSFDDGVLTINGSDIAVTGVLLAVGNQYKAGNGEAHPNLDFIARVYIDNLISTPGYTKYAAPVGGAIISSLYDIWGISTGFDNGLNNLYASVIIGDEWTINSGDYYSGPNAVDLYYLTPSIINSPDYEGLYLVDFTAVEWPIDVELQNTSTFASFQHHSNTARPRSRSHPLRRQIRLWRT